MKRAVTALPLHCHRTVCARLHMCLCTRIYTGRSARAASSECRALVLCNMADEEVDEAPLCACGMSGCACPDPKGLLLITCQMTY